MDWFPKATPYSYDYPTSYDISDNYPDDTWWDWDDNTLIERQEELDNRFDLRHSTEDILKDDTPKILSRFDEYDYSLL